MFATGQWPKTMSVLLTLAKPGLRQASQTDHLRSGACLRRALGVDCRVQMWNTVHTFQSQQRNIRHQRGFDGMSTTVVKATVPEALLREAIRRTGGTQAEALRAAIAWALQQPAPEAPEDENGPPVKAILQSNGDAVRVSVRTPIQAAQALRRRAVRRGCQHLRSSRRGASAHRRSTKALLRETRPNGTKKRKKVVLQTASHPFKVRQAIFSVLNEGRKRPLTRLNRERTHNTS
ncbi:MAG: hypothetical protein KatS3mg115_2447 [Candidatus Poribacteria bacterium]|nr:MAG: hypothetical protein KatS3mg115_2447 [Candidatus Poribacteria bacterium]